MTRLSTAQVDRAAGALLGLAAGDALGVPYEFGIPPRAGELAEMRGGGLGDFAPGEWSDDTSMAMAIADVAATGADLTSEQALEAIAVGFLRWFDSDPPDIGIQTSSVLAATRSLAFRGHVAATMLVEADDYAARHAHSAGNGALMRTAPVALSHLHDRQACASAARAIAALTHADPLAGDSCVLWSEAIRVAVLDGRFAVADGLDLIPADRRADWTRWLTVATQAGSGARFTPNGFTVTALQAALAAIGSTPVPRESPADGSFACLHLQDALHAAVRIGNDTDTVAAIAGALLGARWGASAIPWRWRRAVHGWPGRDGRDVVSLATLAVRGGREDSKGWPNAADVRYDEPAAAQAVPHPYDDDVLLGAHATRGHGASAVVSLCRVGRAQACFDDATVVVESRLLDREDPAANPNLHFALYDAADAVRGLRAEGHRVLLHCVAARQRTPSVAVAYATLLGHDARTSQLAVASVLPAARGAGQVWEAAAELGPEAGGLRMHVSTSPPDRAWDDPRWLEKSDRAWQRRLRLLQGWWRANRTALAPGPRSKSDPRLVVSMLPVGVGLEPNLMTSEAVMAAGRAIELLERERRPGLIQRDRLWRNLLSSQPLCFNLFGHLAADPQSLLPWVHTLAPSATQVVRVELEWAPEAGTLGGSAFDAFVEYALPAGQKGFVGVECKYAENLKASLAGPAAEKYRTATTEPLWAEGAVEALDVTGLRQFWFNHLLTQLSEEAGGYAEACSVVVACADDVKAADAVAAVSAQLADPGRLRFSSLESLVATVAGHDDWKHRFTERYLDFAPIAHLVCG